MLSSPQGGEGTKALGSRGGRAVLTGLVGGAFSGLTGAGGGAIMAPLQTGQLKLSQHRAHGTSLAIIMFIAIAGVAGYWRAGNIDWRSWQTLVPGAVAGVYVGAKAMVTVPARQISLLFGTFPFVPLFIVLRQRVWPISVGVLLPAQLDIDVRWCTCGLTWLSVGRQMSYAATRAMASSNAATIQRV